MNKVWFRICNNFCEVYISMFFFIIGIEFINIIKENDLVYILVRFGFYWKVLLVIIVRNKSSFINIGRFF